jgi:hypothetical protein
MEHLVVSYRLLRLLDYGSTREEPEMNDAELFAAHVARAMNDLASSNVFFIMQQAYHEDIEWEEVQAIFDRVIATTTIPK